MHLALPTALPIRAALLLLPPLPTDPLYCPPCRKSRAAGRCYPRMGAPRATCRAAHQTRPPDMSCAKAGDTSLMPSNPAKPPGGAAAGSLAVAPKEADIPARPPIEAFEVAAAAAGGCTRPGLRPPG